MGKKKPTTAPEPESDLNLKRELFSKYITQIAVYLVIAFSPTPRPTVRDTQRHPL
jgi:hypothetical protein